LEQTDSKGCVLVHMIGDTSASSFCHCKACPERSERTRQNNLVADTPGQIWREGEFHPHPSPLPSREREFLLGLPRLRLAMTVGERLAMTEEGARNDVWCGRACPDQSQKWIPAKTKPLVGFYSPAGVV